MTENEIARQVVDSTFKIHTSIGPGLLGKKLGLLINFNVALIKNGITRIVNGLPE